MASTWATAAHRAENVALGCLVVLLMDGLLWPESSAAKLKERIRKDTLRVGQLSAELIMAYLSGRTCPSEGVLPTLQAARLTYSRLLKEMGSEPEDPEAPLEALAAQAEQVHLLVDHCAALRDIHLQTRGDQVQSLMRSELERFSQCLRAAAEAYERQAPEWETRLGELRVAGAQLELSYEAVRGERGTLAYATPEVFRLLGALYHCGALVRGFATLEGQGLGGQDGQEFASP